VNEQGPPVSPEQMTLVVPNGNVEPDEGLQTIFPHPVPDPLGVKVTTAPHCPGVFGAVMSGGQSTSQVACVCAGRSTNAVALLSSPSNSAVELETEALLDMPVPPGVAGSIWKTNTNWAVVLAGRLAMVHVETPPEGLAQVKVGPVTWVSD